MKKGDKMKRIKQATNNLNALIRAHIFSVYFIIAIAIVIIAIYSLKSVIENYPNSAMVFVTSILVIITAFYVHYTNSLVKLEEEKKEKEKKTFLNVLRYEIERNHSIARKWDEKLMSAANNKSTKDVTLPPYYHASWSAFRISDGINYLDEKQIHNLFEIYETFSKLKGDFDQIKALEVEGRKNYDSIQEELNVLRVMDQKNRDELRDMKNFLKNIKL